MSTPETTIYICSGVPLNSRYNHSLYFDGVIAQRNYMQGYVVKTLPAYSFVRRSWSLKVEAELVEAVKWNYLYFHYPNDAQNYYYFINRVEYVNDSTVELFLELDLLQTYLFDLQFDDCLIEREHVTDDEVGKHTVSEGLDAGELVYRKYETLTELTDYVIMILASYNPYTTTNKDNANTTGGVYGNVYSGLGLYAVPITKYKNLTDKIATLTDEGLIDGIVSMWLYPKALIELEGEQDWSDDMWCFNVSNVCETSVNFKPSANIGGYSPKNNKLMTYPFNVIEVSNNSGSTVTYREEFLHHNADGYIDFNVFGALTPDAGMRLAPDDYLNGNTETGNNHAINTPAFPTCAWNSDTYKIWLAQNQHTLDTQKATSAVSAVAGLASVIGGTAMLLTGAGSGVGIGMIGGGTLSMVNSVIQVSNSIGTQEAAEKQADQMRGSFSPSINAAMKMHTFTIAQKQITEERAKIIDGYFTMYGYKVNRIGRPSIHNRHGWTYVKTVGCNITGDFNNEDKTKIESIFDKGVTWWTTNAVMGRYDGANPTL